MQLNISTNSIHHGQQKHTVKETKINFASSIYGTAVIIIRLNVFKASLNDNSSNYSKTKFETKVKEACVQDLFDNEYVQDLSLSLNMVVFQSSK